MRDWNDNKIRASFYSSRSWQDLRRYKLCKDPFCEKCSTPESPVMAQECHHIAEVKDCPEKRLILNNLMSLCKPCHSKISSVDLQHYYAKSLDLQILNRKWKINVKDHTGNGGMNSHPLK